MRFCFFYIIKILREHNSTYTRTQLWKGCGHPKKRFTLNRVRRFFYANLHQIAKSVAFFVAKRFAVHRMNRKVHKEKTAQPERWRGFPLIFSTMIPTGLEPATSTLSR